MFVVFRFYYPQYTELLYSPNRNPSIIPRIDPTALNINPEKENTPAPQRLGIYPPTNPPTIIPAVMSFFLSIVNSISFS